MQSVVACIPSLQMVLYAMKLCSTCLRQNPSDRQRKLISTTSLSHIPTDLSGSHHVYNPTTTSIPLSTSVRVLLLGDS